MTLWFSKKQASKRLQPEYLQANLLFYILQHRKNVLFNKTSYLAT